MRSAKDLVDIVNDVRSRSKQGTRARSNNRVRILPNKENQDNSQQPPHQSQKAKKQSRTASRLSPKQNFETVPTQSDLNNTLAPARQQVFQTNPSGTLESTSADLSTLKKLRKLEVLAATDKETIEVQQKKMHVLRSELTHTKREFSALQKNYDSVAVTMQNKAVSLENIQEIREGLQSQLRAITEAKLAAEERARLAEKKLEEAEHTIKSHRDKIAHLNRELGLTQKEMSNRYNTFEATLNAANAHNMQLQHQQEHMQKSMQETINKLVGDLEQSQTSLRDLEAKISLMGTAERKVIELTDTLKLRDQSLDEMVPQIERLKADVYTSNRMLNSTKADLTIKTEQLEDARMLMSQYSTQNESLAVAKKLLEQQVEKLSKKLKRQEDMYSNHAHTLQEMSVKMDLANDSVKSLSEQLSGTKRALDSKTKGWQQERERLKNDLEKAQTDLRDFDKNVNHALTENEQIKQNVQNMNQQLDEQKREMDLIKQQIFEKIERVVKADKERDEALKKVKDLKQSITLVEEQRERIRDQLKVAEASLKEEKIKNDDLGTMKNGLNALAEKMNVMFEPIESTLSCLSCLEFLSAPNPCTLVCGHAICRKCYEEHSDPTSSESIVFCEDCKIKTQNTEIRDSQVTTLLTAKFSNQRSILKQMNQVLGRA